MKLKCSICKKEFDKNLMSVECPNCYAKGYNNEFNRWKEKFVEEVLKEIEKKKGYSSDIDNEMNELIQVIKQKAECLEEKNAKRI